MTRLYFWVLSCLLLFCSNAVIASTKEENLAQLRKWFSRAESIAHRPNSSESRYLKKQLKDYPLAPYVTLKTYMRFPFLSNKDNIQAFLSQYEKTPLDRPLRKKWLNYLAKQKQPTLFLHSYRDIDDVGIQCHHIRFRMEQPELREIALKEIDHLWLVGKSQPKACDYVFSQWQKAGRRTHSMIYQRLTLAANGGKHTLVPYLKGLLPVDYHYLADLWLKVRRSPSYVSRVSRFPGINPKKETAILTYGLKRLIWRDRNLALKSWHKLRTRFPFTEQQKQEIADKFALGLAIKNHQQSGNWLDIASKGTEDPEIHRWHLAHVIRQQNWSKAIEIVANAPENLAQNEQFRYWNARSLGMLQASEKETAALTLLAKERHFYGFMASGKLGKTPSLVNQPIQFSEQEFNQIANMPAVKRAYEFVQIKRMASARREWRHLMAKITPKQQAIAGVIADSWHWHDQAIRTFAKSGYMNDITRRFPLAFKDTLSAGANNNNISPEWAFAITRRESSFMTDAYSGAGARGLMQLMPGTARFIEKERVKVRKLFDPKFNVQLGTRYLRYLMDRMDNNPVLATAAYNAGWHRVKDWLPSKKPLPMDIWVETIPFKETRNYVKAVMAYKQIYAHQLGSNENLFQEYSQMNIPKLGSF